MQSIKYVIGEVPKRLVSHNRRSWEIIVQVLSEKGPTSADVLAMRVSGHKDWGRADEKRRPERFIQYCIKNRWLVPQPKP